MIELTVRNHLASVNDNRVEDGVWHSARIVYDDGAIDVYVDGGLVLSYVLAFPDTTYSGFGFSSGVCGRKANHRIDNFMIRDLSCEDEDADGVCNDADACPGTVASDAYAGVPSVRLGVNRFADTDGDRVFDTTLPRGNGPGLTFSIADTAGCNCAQIIDELELGKGHRKFGCSISATEEWLQWLAEQTE